MKRFGRPGPFPTRISCSPPLKNGARGADKYAFERIWRKNLTTGSGCGIIRYRLRGAEFSFRLRGQDSGKDYAGKSDKVAALAKAIWNYGYFAQTALPGGPKHPAMPDTYAGKANLVESLSSYPVAVNLEKEIISSAGYSLDLQSETAVNFYLKTDQELTKDNVKVTAGSGVTFDYTVEKSGSSWRVQITGKGAHKLGSVFTLKTDGAEISASALSYAQNCRWRSSPLTVKM